MWSPCSSSVVRAASSAFATVLNNNLIRVRSSEITELRHGDAPKCESRRILAQGDALQCAEGITHRERSRRGRDQRVHWNPAILVTPTVRHAVLIYLTTTNKHVVCED